MGASDDANSRREGDHDRHFHKTIPTIDQHQAADDATPLLLS